MKSFDIIIVGGGAAGFFAALRAAECNPRASIAILEKSGKYLSKVKVSGGGRCNLTHQIHHVSSLIKNYPRGGNGLKKLFSSFSVEHTIEWFRERGVPVKVEEDGRMFPQSNSSQTVIDCFLQEARRLGIEFFTHFPVEKVEAISDGFRLYNAKGENNESKLVLLATGGYAKAESYQWLAATGHSIVPPVPSLFTFNSPENPIKELAGISVPAGLVKVEGTKLQYEGPVLITHWGFSGPAILKLSAFGAEWINSRQYRFAIHIRWVGEDKEDDLRDHLSAYQQQHPKRQVNSYPLFELPQRLWTYLCSQSDIGGSLRWGDLSKKSLNKLVEGLFRDRHEIGGKTTFKEEFVTCGGIPLQELSLPEMESRILPGLFFAGEVLNVDGITGGFNFQHAWTSGWLAGTAMAKRIGTMP